MNILYLTQLFSSTSGGGEAIFYNLAQRMAERGHNVHVICQDYTDSEQILKQIFVHRVKPAIKRAGGLPPSITHNLRYIVNSLMKGFQVIKEHKIDIIHSNNWSPVIAGSMLSRILRVPLVCTIHDIFTTRSPHYWKDWAAQNNVSFLSAKIGPMFEKLTTIVPSDKIHAVSAATKKDLMNFGVPEYKIEVIPNGIDLSSYAYDFRSEDYGNYVIFIGRLVFYKNLEVVIRAFSNVVEIVPDARLLVIGDGPMMRVWKELVATTGLSKAIEFTGYIPEVKKRDLLKKSSALVLPSLHEGFGLVILEAFAMCKPAIVPNISPYTEIIDDGVNGFLLPPDDPMKWALAITKILQNRNISVEMGRNARMKVNQKYQLENVVKLIESMYIETTKLGKSK